MVHTFHWGIQVGSDIGLSASNPIYVVDSAISVLATAAWPGISSAAETIFDTTYSTVALAPIRLPTGFQGTVVDLGPGIKKTDLTPVLFVTSPAATSVAMAWSGTSVNLSANVGGMIVFDTGTASDSQTLQASWTGPLASFDVTGLSAADVSFQLSSAAAVGFDGSGFTPSTTYNVMRANSGGTNQILSAQSTPAGGLTFTIPTSTPSTYAVSPGSVSDITPPVTAYSASGSGGTNNWYTSSVTVSLSATDDSSGVAAIHFRTDGGAWQSYAGPFAVAADGSHAADYYSTDNTGNTENLHSVTVKLDTVAPVSSAQLAGTPAADGSYVSSVDVTLTSTDATSGVQSSQYRVDAGAWRSYASAFPLSGNGTHTLEYAAMDVAGNVEGAKSSVVRISGSSFGPPVTVSWTGSDSASGITGYMLSIDGGPTQSVGMTTTLTRRWSDGDHTVRITAYDAAGNQDATVISFRVNPEASSVFGFLQTLPLLFPLIALALLLFAVAFWRRRLRHNEAEDRGGFEHDDLPDEYESSEF